MPLDDMLGVLDEEGKEQQEAVMDKAQEEADKIRAEAQVEGERLRKEQLEQIIGPLNREKAKILNDAKLKVKKKMAESKTDLFNQAQARAAQRIKEFQATSGWYRSLEIILSEAIRDVSGKAVVTVGPADREAAQDILSKTGREYELIVDEAVSGGAIASTEDGRVRYVNTVAARLERAGSYLRPIVAASLFGESDGG